jgi:hypothetical protein
MSQELLHYLLPVHNLLRWVILILLLIAIVNAFSGMNSNRPFTKSDKRVGLFLMISTHLNFLVGLYLWLVGGSGLNLIRTSGFGPVMKDSASRFYAVEHLVGMLIAVVLITIGRSVSKKNYNDRSKHKKTFWYFLIALVLILVSIPWPFREAVARPWIRGL